MLRTAILYLTICCCAVACVGPQLDGATDGGDADGGPDDVTEESGSLAFDPGVATDKPLNTLTDEEREVACAAMVDYYAASGVHEAECILDAYVAAEVSGSMENAVLREVCAERFASCLVQRRENSGFGHLCSAAFDCTGTVTQAVECAVDAGEGKAIATSVLPRCEEMTAEDLSRPQSISLPPSPPCAALNATCN